MKKIIFLLCLFSHVGFAQESKTSEQTIRKIVAEMLQQKEQKIKSLEARIQQLEKQLNLQTAQRQEIKSVQTSKHEDAHHSLENTEQSLISDLQQQVQELKTQASEQGLEISGFFDFSGQTNNKREQTFTLGAVEVGLEYAYDEHFAAGAALVWDGDTAEIGTAFIDFHMFDQHIPPRGRIFDNPGFHLQAGRFDLPFAIDYQYFAAPDRVTFSAPLTTELIQNGGFNGDGVRLYGTENILNYALFWTNSVFEDEGMSIGGRIGLNLGRNQFQLHRHDNHNILEFGFSHITDLDGQSRVRNSVYAGDLSFQYGILQIMAEVLWLDSHQDIIDGNNINYGENNGFAYHLTLVNDLEPLTTFPLHFYFRFDHWNPQSAVIVDSEDDTQTYAISDIERISIGFNYLFNDYLQIKFEYSDSLSGENTILEIEDEIGTAQIVVAF